MRLKLINRTIMSGIGLCFRQGMIPVHYKDDVRLFYERRPDKTGQGAEVAQPQRAWENTFPVPGTPIHASSLRQRLQALGHPNG